ncbi:MAG TPA: primosome assembly protein PriA, partial [Nocardioides sp.]|nr:primosome assembly protein PriA [Nocardioides sp.]
TLSGAAAALDDVLTLARLPPGAEVLGPVEHGEPGEWRAVVRVPRSQGLALSRALGEVQRVRSARKLGAVRVQVDPPAL